MGIDRQYDQVGRTAGVERRRRQGQAAEGANRTEARLFQAGDEVGGKQRPLWGGVHLDAPTVLPFNEQRNVEGDTACRQVIVGEAPDEDLLAVVDAALGGEEAGLSLPAQVVIQVLGDQQAARAEDGGQAAQRGDQLGLRKQVGEGVAEAEDGIERRRKGPAGRFTRLPAGGPARRLLARLPRLGRGFRQRPARPELLRQLVQAGDEEVDGLGGRGDGDVRDVLDGSCRSLTALPSLTLETSVTALPSLTSETSWAAEEALPSLTSETAWAAAFDRARAIMRSLTSTPRAW